MTQTNYYVGIKKGGTLKQADITVGTSAAGTGVDVELNMQIVNGSTATNISKKDVVRLLRAIEVYILSGGIAHLGTDLPAI